MLMFAWMKHALRFVGAVAGCGFAAGKIQRTRLRLNDVDWI
jgi:hypothetical protein